MNIPCPEGGSGGILRSHIHKEITMIPVYKERLVTMHLLSRFGEDETSTLRLIHIQQPGL